LILKLNVTGWKISTHCLGARMKHLLIITHAPSQNTVRLRDAVIEGALSIKSAVVDCKALSPFNTDPSHLMNASAIILGTPENLGYMSGAMKDFFDRCYYPCLEHTQGLPFSTFIRAGHDGTGTKLAIQSITTGLKWTLVQEPLILHGDWQEHFIPQCHELGAVMAAGLDAGIY
jgi:multimeric flavodoxin WrbA